MPKQVKLRLWRVCKTKTYSFLIKLYKVMRYSLKQESHYFSGGSVNAYYFADILSYDDGVEMLKDDTKFVKTIVWDVYDGFSQTVCDSHKSHLLSDYCEGIDLGILFERIDPQASEAISKNLD